jgi:uncharacterized protein YuzE
MGESGIGVLLFEGKALRVVTLNRFKEISEGLIADFDSEANVVGIDIDNASKKLDLMSLEMVSLPTIVTKVA